MSIATILPSDQMNHSANAKIMRNPLVKAAAIDYANIDEVEGYQLLACKLYELEGGFGYPRRVTPAIKHIEDELSVWLREVRRRLTDAPLPDVYRLLNAYDLPFRIYNGTAPDGKFVRGVRIGAIQRWLKGEKTITPTGIARLISQEIERDCRTLDRRYISYYYGLIGEWYDELMACGEFRDIKLQEAFQRLGLLMDEDLYAYVTNPEDVKTIKRKWADRYCISDLTTLDTPSLQEYIPLYRKIVATGLTPRPDKSTDYHHLLTELSTRPDLNPLTRQAIEIDLRNRAELKVG